MLVYLKALQYSMSESDQLNSTNNTGNTFISLDQASTIMADQTQGGNPQHYNSGEWAMRQYLLVCLEKCLPNCPTDNECPNNNKKYLYPRLRIDIIRSSGEKMGRAKE